MRPIFVAWAEANGLPGWIVPGYLVLVGLSGLVGGAITLRRAQGEHAQGERDSRAWIEARALGVAYLSALVGGYLFEWIRHLPAAVAAGSIGPILDSGRAAYGGLLFGMFGTAIYLRRHGQPVLPFLDRATPLIGISFVLVRIGCFLAGCDYGTPTASGLGVRFPPGSPAALDHAALGFVGDGRPSLPVHAAQLYEAAVAAIATLVALSVSSRGRAGAVIAIWLCIYAAGRFAVEALRGDVERGVFLGLSTAQYVSVAVFAFAAWWLFVGAKRRTMENGGSK